MAFIDETLLLRAQKGDAVAMGDLLAAHETQMYQVAYHMLGNTADAQDAVQEAMIRCYRNISAFKGQSAFATWVHRITVNVCLDEKRRQKSRPGVSLDELMETGQFAHPSAENPAEIQERRERMRAVGDALSSLPDEQRLALVLRDVQGRAYDEIADIMGCNLNTVKSRISRGRLAIRSILREKRSNAELFAARNV